MKKLLSVLLLFVFICGLTGCGPKPINKDKALEKTIEFIRVEYKVSEGNEVEYNDVSYVEITANGNVTRDDLIGDVCFSIRININGVSSGNQRIYYDAAEDKVDWARPSTVYNDLRDLIDDGDLKGVYGDLDDVEGVLK